MSGSSTFKHLSSSVGHFLKKIIPYFEILGPTILRQIYPFLSEIMDERGVIFSLRLHPPPGEKGKKYDTTLIHDFAEKGVHLKQNPRT